MIWGERIGVFEVLEPFQSFENIESFEPLEAFEALEPFESFEDIESFEPLESFKPFEAFFNVTYPAVMSPIHSTKKTSIYALLLLCGSLGIIVLW